jgi:hypothetical protein
MTPNELRLQLSFVLLVQKKFSISIRRAGQLVVLYAVYA